MTSLTPLNYLDIQKHSTLDVHQFTLKEVDFEVPSNQAHVLDELTDLFKLTGHILLALTLNDYAKIFYSIKLFCCMHNLFCQFFLLTKN